MRPSQAVDVVPLQAGGAPVFVRPDCWHMLLPLLAEAYNSNIINLMCFKRLNTFIAFLNVAKAKVARV